MSQRMVMISGSLRDGSTNSAVARTAAMMASELGLEATVYGGLRSLPHFDPDLDVDPLPPAVAELRRVLAAADAVLFCVPEYAGGLPGSFKNLLDWTVGGTELGDMPIGWINIAQGPTGGARSHDALRVTLGYVTARIVEDACVHTTIGRRDVGPDGTIANDAARAVIVDVLSTLRSVLSTPPVVSERSC